MSAEDPVYRAMSKLRVIRGTLVGVRECLVDATEFVDRGIAKVEDARGEIVRAFADAGIPIPKSFRPQPAAQARKKAPAKKTRARKKRA